MASATIIIEPTDQEIALAAEESGDADNLFNHPDFALFAFWQRERVVAVGHQDL